MNNRDYAYGILKRLRRRMRQRSTRLLQLIKQGKTKDRGKSIGKKMMWSATIWEIASQMLEQEMENLEAWQKQTSMRNLNRKKK